MPCDMQIDAPECCIISARLENISAGGVRVIIKQKLCTSTIINLKIHDIKSDPIHCQGRVLWVFTRDNPQCEGEYLFDTGIEFCRIEDDDLAAIKNLIVAILSKQK